MKKQNKKKADVTLKMLSLWKILNLRMTINQTASLPLPNALKPVGRIYFNCESDSNLWIIQIMFFNNSKCISITECKASHSKNKKSVADILFGESLCLLLNVYDK